MTASRSVHLFQASVLALTLLATVGIESADANHGRPYSANVREARQWLRDHTHKGAFRAAHVLWENESGWAVHAQTGSCWGIPQSCPG